MMKNKIIHSSHTFEIILESSHDAMIIVNKEGQITLINNQTENLFGFERAEIIGQRIEILLPNKFKESHQSLLANFFLKPEVRVMGKGRELYARKKDGSEFPVEIGLNPLETTVGTMVLAAIIDVTERKMVESIRLKKESDKKFQAIIEHAFDALTLRDADGKLLYISPGFNKMLGYSFEEIKDKEVSSLFHPEDVPDLLNRIATAKKSPGAPVYGLNRMKHKNGHYLWVEGNVTNLLEDDSVHALTGHFRNITEKKIIEEKLIQSEQKFRALVESNVEPMVMLNEKGIVTYVSPATERLMGYTLEEFLGKDGSVFFHPDEMEIVFNRMETSFKNPGKPIYTKNRVKHKDGHYIWTEGTTTNFLNDAQINAFVGNFRDITERIISEEKIIKANRLYAFLSLINQTLVHADTEKKVLDEACRIAVKYGNLMGAWVGIFGQDYKTISIESQCGKLPDNLFQLGKIPIENVGSLNHILESGTHFISNNIKETYSPGYWKNVAIKHEINSLMVLPIVKSGILYASFFIYAQETGYFGKEEIELFVEATNDISFALNVFEKERHRKEMEDSLIHSELRMKQAQSIAHFGNWEIDFNTRKSFWSDEASNIFGITGDEVHDSNFWRSFIHPDEIDYVRNSIFAKGEKADNKGFHHRILRKDGNVRYIYSQTQVAYSQSGEPARIFGVSHDETERVETEREKEKMMRDLIQRNQDLEQFSYIISHNLRAPVANIIGLTNMIGLRDQKIFQDKELIEHLSVSVKKMDEVIMDLNNILQVGKNINERKEKVILPEILNNVILTHEKIIYDSGIDIKYNFDQVEELYSLKSYIYSIFHNLISNSIKFRRTGVQPIVEISSYKEGDLTVLIFKDNGLGIDLEKRGNHVFGLYKRFHPFVEGKGMGLFMVKTQVQALGGTITIASEVNKGTEFRIAFNAQ